MGTSNFTFARTLEAVDRSTVDPDARFQKFSSFPPEIRIAIWESMLPTAEDEPPAIFAQYPLTHVEMPRGLIPIRMTTTCAALLHVNQESRRTALSWAQSLGYKLCYRQLGFDLNYWKDREHADDQSPEKKERENLPVQGPIFVRPWDPAKDILSFTHLGDYGRLPQEWDESCRGGEHLHDIQHLAFNLDHGGCLEYSSWFYYLIGMMPNLKSISFDCDAVYERFGDRFEQRYIETRELVDGEPGPDSEQGASSRDGQGRVYSRWEPVDCEAMKTRGFQEIEMFEWYLMEGYIARNMWPSNAPLGDDTRRDTSEEWEGILREEYETGRRPWNRPHNKERLRRVPPWIWNHEKGEFAFERRGFRMVERRGYDNVGGGLVVKVLDLYQDWAMDNRRETLGT
ncbi:hypothetical protein CC79DRAFT_1390975 [Sarocladium strictum]